MAEERGISPEVIKELHELGFSQTTSAEALGVTRSTVNYWWRKLGLTVPVKHAQRHLPWPKPLPPAHRDTTHYQRLTWHLEYLETGGEGMSRFKLQRLRQWYEFDLLKFNTVMEYDPDILPYPQAKNGGWRYVPRTASDENLVLRENKNTRIPANVKDWYRIPERLPEW